MRENVLDELKQMQPEDESKKKMLDILKRLHMEEEMESDGEDGMLCFLCYTPMPYLLCLRCAVHISFLS
jgi:hypothetical protein